MLFNLKPENWVTEHSDYLFSYAIVRIFKKEDALDLVQETFYSALKGKEGFKGNSTERTWLTAILKRKIIDYYRKKASETETHSLNRDANSGDFFIEVGRNQGHWKKERIPKTGSWEDGQLEKKEFQVIFNNCLSHLSPTMAATFTLSSIDGLSTEEVCKELNISSSNLWTSLHRAKLQLRECMEHKWFGKRKQ
jgi:RNA polymerase sigma-70 factor (TIGR02943 family)